MLATTSTVNALQATAAPAKTAEANPQGSAGAAPQADTSFAKALERAQASKKEAAQRAQRNATGTTPTASLKAAEEAKNPAEADTTSLVAQRQPGDEDKQPGSATPDASNNTNATATPQAQDAQTNAQPSQAAPNASDALKAWVAGGATEAGADAANLGAKPVRGATEAKGRAERAAALRLATGESATAQNGKAEGTQARSPKAEDSFQAAANAAMAAMAVTPAAPNAVASQVADEANKALSAPEASNREPAGSPEMVNAGMLNAPAANTAPAAPARTFAAELAQAVGSPEFAPALGSQLTLLLRQGVQEAQLSLNPADMGPISVQIQMDGQGAHIDFTAAHAATRSALEASLPALASALNEAGFTLTGGGVFQQSARQDGGNGRGGNNPSGRGTGAPDGPLPALSGVGGQASVRTRVGLVDAYV